MDKEAGSSCESQHLFHGESHRCHREKQRTTVWCLGKQCRIYFISTFFFLITETLPISQTDRLPFFAFFFYASNNIFVTNIFRQTILKCTSAACLIPSTQMFSIRPFLSFILSCPSILSCVGDRHSHRVSQLTFNDWKYTSMKYSCGTRNKLNGGLRIDRPISVTPEHLEHQYSNWQRSAKKNLVASHI